MTTSLTALPGARGPVSAAILGALRGSAAPAAPGLDAADPFGDDLHLALHLCYELHYRGLPGVAAEQEWDPKLLAVRALLESRFESGLRDSLPGGTDVEAEFDALLTETGAAGAIGFLVAEGQWWHVRELFAHRSVYHLKEADPHAWAIPRLSGPAKAGLVAVEFDEFGGGHADRVHAALFADLLAAAGLPNGYLALLEHVPGPMLALVNMMSMFGLHRALRGALVGHFAAAEITTAPAARRMDRILRRLGAPDACRFFYTEHIEADAVHEQVMRHDVAGGLLAAEPELAADVVFGIQATGLLEEYLDEHLASCWQDGRSSLRQPLP
ncbi:iron-containing redox enzyme family protein [Amycolatopsis benzoatilytica]|uniref:iron-containing redox enzyme family protein n=1 Tax=Amycolatopsis benzoatilytica TaxID=346045 RepID=UPI00048594B0|nr:iron-containing redox enzyme family protein [Amycolatopsis benzoatilytica]